MNDLHAHISYDATDCDGRITREYVSLSDGKDPYDFRVERLALSVSVLAEAGTLNITADGWTWDEPTEEGHRHEDVRFCTDDCDDAKPLYRDHRAESMGY